MRVGGFGLENSPGLGYKLRTVTEVYDTLKHCCPTDLKYC